MNTILECLKYPIRKFQKLNSISENNLNVWISVIENSPNKIKSTIQNLSVEQLNLVDRPDGLSIKQVILHCADSNMNSLIRFKLAQTEDLPIIKPYDKYLRATLTDANSNDLQSSIQIIEGVHLRWVLLLKSFTKVEFSKQFLHPESGKVFELDEVLGLYTWHCNHHFTPIEQALKC